MIIIIVIIIIIIIIVKRTALSRNKTQKSESRMNIVGLHSTVVLNRVWYSNYSWGFFMNKP